VPEAPQRPAPSNPAPPRVDPLGQARYRLQLTADATLHDQLRQAQALMRHQVPDGDLGTILGKAMTLLLESLHKQRFAEVKRPRAQRSPGLARDASDAGDAQVAGQHRHIPASVRRSVALRDGHRCTFVSDDGHRCGEMAFVEFHHDHAYARGGRHDVDNIRLLCRAHNALLAERDFGRPFMRAKQARNVPHGQAQFPGMSPP
jgi:5-methylcytosine-specific restriction endonuclease McrA